MEQTPRAGTPIKRVRKGKEEGLDMTPTETLKHEHQIVLLVLKGAGREARSSKKNGTSDITKVDQMLDFFKTFVDRCHHTKEERHLFPALERHSGSPKEAPIEVLLQEHEAGRQRVKAIGEALPEARLGRPDAVAEICENLLAYVKLLRSHIEKEDKFLFPFAEKVLTRKEQAALEDAFEKVEAEEMGEGVHEKYHQLAHDLAEG